MAAKTPRLPPAEPTDHEVGLLEAAVRDNVIQELGEPADLRLVQVKRVWGGNYRVNVYVGRGPASLEVAHSYFLKADSDGNILSSSPAIARAH